MLYSKRETFNLIKRTNITDEMQDLSLAANEVNTYNKANPFSRDTNISQRVIGQTPDIGQGLIHIQSIM